MKLYYVPGACSLGPHIIIREASLDVALDKVTFGAQRTTESGKDFFSISPQGAVPVLELDNGEVLTEAQVVLQYLANQNPKANLAIEDGPQRWRFLETLNFIATELHKGTSPLFKNPGDDAKAAATANLVNRYKLLEQKLGDQDYLHGQFTVADAYAFVVLNWARRFEIPVSPKLTAYFERIRARPAVQQTLKEEGLPTS